MPYASQILEIMPLVISIWTGLTLAWGVVAGCWFDILLHSSTTNAVRKSDKSCLISIWVANTIIFVFGFIVPFTAPSIHQSVGDAILVLNIFYGVFLATCTIGLVKWTNAIFTHPPQSTQTQLP